jgi:hypothetical protein
MAWEDLAADIGELFTVDATERTVIAGLARKSFSIMRRVGRKEREARKARDAARDNAYRTAYWAANPDKWRAALARDNAAKRAKRAARGLKKTRPTPMTPKQVAFAVTSELPIWHVANILKVTKHAVMYHRRKAGLLSSQAKCARDADVMNRAAERG